MTDNWLEIARPEQLPPRGTDWWYWQIWAGRGWGKTRAVSEYINAVAEFNPGVRMLGVARTSSDIRTIMVEGESGILATAPKGDNFPVYRPSNRTLTWPNGSTMTFVSADQGPEAVRGIESEITWWDEPSLRGKKGKRYFRQLRLSTRLGKQPKIVTSGTPTSLNHQFYDFAEGLLISDPTGVRRTQGTTFDNHDALSVGFLDALRDAYYGTRLARSELFGERPDAGTN